MKVEGYSNELGDKMEWDAASFAHQTDYLCNGELITWQGPFQEVFSPICAIENETPGQILIGDYPLLDEATSMTVLESATQAYGNGSGFWPTLEPMERIHYMMNFLREFKKIKAEVVQLLIWEIGKTRADAEKEFDRTVLYIKETIEYYRRKSFVFKKYRKKEDIIAQVSLRPRGIVLCMGPYNYPLNETFTTLIPALITGNVVIFKPPRLGVLLHGPVLKVLQKVFPAGVVNTVYGEGQKVISPLMSSGKIDVLAFIGSSKVADILKRLHPKPHRLHTIFGLEAKNPAIVLSDCNIEKTIKEAVKGSLSYNGQRCTALKIFFVESSIVDEFVGKMSEAVLKLKLGVPWEEGVDITPLPETSRSLYLQELIEDAKRYGGRVVNEHGGEYSQTYFKPAVIYPTTTEMRVFKEEQFGPVVPIMAFDDINNVIEYVAQSDYGQQLSIFSGNTKRINKLCTLLGNQVTRININTQCQRGPDTMPFTGRKDSAQGVLSVSEAIKELTIPLVLAKNKK